TRPEIWEKTGWKLYTFVAAAGTGGTVADVPRFLKTGWKLYAFVAAAGTGGTVADVPRFLKVNTYLWSTTF
nr:cysteine synthase 2 [Tanacetum cinerariifolium]